MLEPVVHRDAELTELAGLLAAAPLLTLTGTGGVGKTTLARALVERVPGSFPDGSWWVDLAPVTDDDAVAGAVAAALPVPAAAGVGPVDRVVSWLAGRRALIVLDNCEHLVAACAEVALTLASSSDAVRVVATSREPLGVPGELSWRTPSLAVPPTSSTLGVADLDAWGATALFVRRAELADPGLVLTDDDAAAVADICRRLDGLPLAIGLAGVLVRVMPVAEIRDSLEEGFGSLDRGDRTAPPRHRTLSASVAWSHDLLGAVERRVLYRLAVFLSTFTADDAEQVCADVDLPAAEARTGLYSLVDRNMVDHLGKGRYRLLETIRHFARAQSAAAGELDRARDRHLAWCLRICAERGIAPLRMTPVDRIATERLPDLHAALDRAIDTGHPGIPELVHVVAALQDATGRHAENRKLAAKALAASPPGSAQRTDVLAAIGVTATEVADVDTSQLQRAALDEACDPYQRARLLAAVHGSFLSGGDPDATGALDEALVLFRQLGAISDEIEVLCARARAFGVCGRQRETRQAVAELTEVLAAHGVSGLVTAAYHAAAIWDESLPETAELFGRHGSELPRLPTVFFGQVMCAYLARDPSLTGDALLPGGQCSNLPGFPSLFSSLARALPAIVAGDHDAAARELADGLAARPHGSGGWVRMCDADVALRQGDRARAQAAAAAVRAAVDGRIEPRLTVQLACVDLALALADDDPSRAHELAHQMLAVAVDHDHKLLLVDGLEAVAATSALLGRPLETGVLLGAAEAHRCRSGYRFRPAALEAPVAALLDEVATSDGFQAGREMGLAEAARLASRGRGERHRAASGWPSLTPAELEVVGAICDGGTNRQIAERLFVSVATVKTHLVHIYAKLGVRTRAELAAAAARREGASEGA